MAVRPAHIFRMETDIEKGWLGMKSRTKIIGLGLFLLLLGLAGYILLAPVPIDPLDGTSWKLLTFDNQHPLEGSEITAKFEDKDLEGLATCNKYYASYRISGNSIEIDLKLITLVGCPGGLDEQEDIILDYLDGAQTFEINAEGQLLIYRADGQALVFAPQGE